MTRFLYETENGNKYIIMNTKAPKIAFIIHQQQIPQMKGMQKIHFRIRCKATNDCNTTIWIDLDYIQNLL